MLQYSVDHQGAARTGGAATEGLCCLKCMLPFFISFKWRRLATQSGQTTTITVNFLQKHSVHSYPETS